MGWIEIRKIGKPEHCCPFPSFMETVKKGIDTGSIWECPICRNRYRYDGAVTGQIQWTKGYPK